ncbi:MAG: acetate uptake transporter [Acidilobus sp.]|nr:acetate uptake transporter [Acidilobus sp.]
MSEKEPFADPSALGLWGFALTTIVLSLHNAGLIPTAGMTLAYAFFWGGMAQVFAGWMDFKRGNLLGGTAFSTYGLFWIGLGLAFVLQAWNGSTFSWGGPEIGTWFIFWGILTLIYTVGANALKARVLTSILALLTITFWVLAAGFLAGSTAIIRAGGWIGLVTGLDALYLGAAVVLNWSFKRAVLPA